MARACGGFYLLGTLRIVVVVALRIVVVVVGTLRIVVVVVVGTVHMPAI